MKKKRRQGGFEHEAPGLGRRLLRAVAALAVLLAVGEGLSLAWIKAQRGVIYYGARDTLASAAAPAKASSAPASADVLHPYLGFTLRPGTTVKAWVANNVGFPVAASLIEAEPGCCDVPRARRDNELLVGIFGGTAAKDFALQAQATPMLGRALRQVPAYADRPVRVLNFALADFHQPQPLLALAYVQALGQALDIVLVIDGVDDVALAGRQARLAGEPSFPVETRWAAPGRELESRRGAVGAETGLARYYRVAGQRWTAESTQCWLASCYLAKRGLAKLAAWRADRLAHVEETQAAGASLFAAAPLAAPGDPLQRAADRWRDSVLAMAGIARQSGALFLDVLQPAPWSPPGGDATAAADPRDAGAVTLLRKAYPEMLARAGMLRTAGVEFLDPAPRYADRTGLGEECCRLTADGNDRLAGVIGEAIATIHAEGRAPQKTR